jgi:hypothetical protein
VRCARQGVPRRVPRRQPHAVADPRALTDDHPLHDVPSCSCRRRSTYRRGARNSQSASGLSSAATVTLSASALTCAPIGSVLRYDDPGRGHDAIPWAYSSAGLRFASKAFPPRPRSPRRCGRAFLATRSNAPRRPPRGHNQ